ncbi:MAG: hypothetical protein AAFO77_11860, partial [Pseudomonadota bacterium]
ADGLLSANLNARFIDADGIVAAIERTSPDVAAALHGIFALRPRVGDAGDEVEMELVVEDGLVRVGFFEFGIFPAF